MHRLLCSPEYFEIEYSINPWMDVKNKVDRKLAFEQWNRLVGKLRELGDELEFIEPVAGLPDMTFSGDAGLVIDRTFIPSNFRVPQRQGEVEHYVRWFEERGYDIHRVPSEINFEGLGDVVFAEKVAVVGHGYRSDARAVEYLQAEVGGLKILCEMKICDPRYFHLAMALCFLDPQTVLYYPAAFDEPSVERLRNAIPNAVPVSEEDANCYFACNNIVIGRRVLIDNCTPKLEKALLNIGYEPVILPMSEFKKSGGSLRCLVLSFINQE